MKDQKEIIQDVIDYIEKNLEKEINLDHISKKIGYSKFYLNRLFAEYTGITIYKYLQNRRLTVAAEKLVKTDKPILQIAYEAGYDTQQSFSFAFKYQAKKGIYVALFVPSIILFIIGILAISLTMSGKFAWCEYHSFVFLGFAMGLFGFCYCAGVIDAYELLIKNEEYSSRLSFKIKHKIKDKINNL